MTSMRRSPAARAWPKPACNRRSRRSKASSRSASASVRATDGSVQRLVVFGLGKLGGGELNFSSDVDLVYAYPQDGESDGARALAAEDYFARLGQQLAKLLDEATADGFCHRVDLRLRPFGNAGRVALPFAGDGVSTSSAKAATGNATPGRRRGRWRATSPRAMRFLETLRPFVYRRYLDYGALDGLREMKAAIAAEVARKELADDIKRGPGGIREIEFLVQALQLIRGGREPALRERRLLPALAGARRMPASRRRTPASRSPTPIASCAGSRTACRCCAMRRRTRCRERPRPRIASRAGSASTDWDALRAALDAQRERVAAEFEALLAPRGRARGAQRSRDLLARAARCGRRAGARRRGLPRYREPSTAACAISRARPACAPCPTRRARGSIACCRRCSTSAARSSQPDAALRRVLPLLHTLLRRASYLALLDEQPAALARLVDVSSGSALLAERIAAHPLLLDELLDRRVRRRLARSRRPRGRVRGDACATTMPKRRCMALNEVRQALSFRIALATLDARQSAQDSARQLAWLADAVVVVVLATGAARSGTRAWPHRPTRASRCSATAASAARNSASAPTSTWCSSTTRRRMRSPTARVRWMRRAGSRGSRRRSSRCSAP